MGEYSQGMGTRIREARRRAGLTQTAFADALDVSQPSVNKWESGQSMPSADKLVALADALDVTTDDLLGRDVTITSSTADLDELRSRDPEQYEVIMAQVRLAIARTRRR